MIVGLFFLLFAFFLNPTIGLLLLIVSPIFFGISAFYAFDVSAF